MQEAEMDCYTSFAQVYDALMDNIAYAEWNQYLTKLLQKNGIFGGSVIAELGCGTGNMTRLLAASGYRMIGVDLSVEMLMLARAKEEIEEPLDILYIQQDMTELSLNGTVDALVSVCDSMNYLTEQRQLEQVFDRVARYMAKDGVFIFDMKTPYFYREVCGANTFAEDREDVSFIWDNYYDDESRINEYALSLFVPCDEADDSLWRKYTEYHYQRAYDVQEVRDAAAKAGLMVHSVYDAFTSEPPRLDSERVYFVVKHKGGA
jgi:ubiquinone/menaquinone biosynthesis C-methylase UbiE